MIVTDQGGPMENILPDKTGLIVASDSEQAILTAIRSLIADHGRRAAMGLEARQYMQNRSFEAAFDETWKMFGTLSADKVAAAG